MAKYGNLESHWVFAVCMRLKLGTLLSWFCKFWKYNFRGASLPYLQPILFFTFSTNWLVISLLQNYIRKIGSINFVETTTLYPWTYITLMVLRENVSDNYDSD